MTRERRPYISGTDRCVADRIPPRLPARLAAPLRHGSDSIRYAAIEIYLAIQGMGNCQSQQVRADLKDAWPLREGGGIEYASRAEPPYFGMLIFSIAILETRKPGSSVEHLPANAIVKFPNLNDVRACQVW
jgi:hypothetical protein